MPAFLKDVRRPGRLIPFAHNDAAAAERKLTAARQEKCQWLHAADHEGVFSMSGDMSPLDELVKLKETNKRLAHLSG